MEWVKLLAVPLYYMDPALVRAGRDAEILFTRSLAYCGLVESAGVVDKAVLGRIDDKRPQASANALVREGLWLDEGTHYRIRSWDKWQDEHDAAADRRRKDRERKREKRRQESADIPVDVSADIPRTVSEVSAECRALDVEVDVEKDKTHTPRPPAAEPDPFADFWSAYPRRTAKGNAVKAYRKALGKATPDAILAGVKRYATETAGTEAKYVAHPATWLNGERWADDPTPLSRQQQLAPLGDPGDGSGEEWWMRRGGVG